MILDKPLDTTSQSENTHCAFEKDNGIHDSVEKQLRSNKCCGNDIENHINQNIDCEYNNTISANNLTSVISSDKNICTSSRGDEYNLKSKYDRENKERFHDKTQTEVDEPKYGFPENESALKQIENMMGRNFSDFMRSLASKYNKE